MLGYIEWKLSQGDFMDETYGYYTNGETMVAAAAAAAAAAAEEVVES